MDSTQREIVGGLGVALIIAALSAAIAHVSITWVGPLLAVGLVLFVVALIGRPQSKRATAAAEADQRIVRVVVEEPMSMQDKRDALRSALERFQKIGNQMNMVQDGHRVMSEAPEWQKNVHSLLLEALPSPMDAIEFERRGLQYAELKNPGAMLRGVNEQIQWLGDLLRRLDSIQLKEDWIP